MIAVDTNILVPFMRTEYPQHSAAYECIRTLAEGTAVWALPWPCLHEFLAVVTNPRIFREPSTPAEAITAVDARLESPTVRLLGEEPGYWSVAKALIEAPGVIGGRVHDARVAALCLLHGVKELWTADRDFSWFPKLRVRNPLA